MQLLSLVTANLLTPSFVCFLTGGVLTSFKSQLSIPKKLSEIITSCLLLMIGLKGGLAIDLKNSFSFLFAMSCIVLWGFIQPFISYFCLKWHAKVDSPSAGAIAGCYGSVSVTTFATATAFLDLYHIPYRFELLALLAIMEIPGLLSGLFLTNFASSTSSISWKKILVDTVKNKTILYIFIGLAIGFFLQKISLFQTPAILSNIFKILLCAFLMDMGLKIGKQRSFFKDFSLRLIAFGMYMPLIGGSIGILIGIVFHLDIGSTLLFAVLAASASYIAVPAAMKLACPKAKESLYLPLSLGITFPFNIIMSIPLFYHILLKIHA